MNGGMRLLHFTAAPSVLDGVTYAGTNGQTTGYLKYVTTEGGLLPTAANERNGMELDGKYAEAAFFGFRSNEKSDETGAFAEGSEPSVTISNLGGSYSVTVIFANNETAAVKAEYLYGDTVMWTTEIANPGRVCQIVGNPAPTPTKIRLTFLRTSEPSTFVKVARIFPGIVTELTGRQLASCDAVRECNVGGMELPAGMLTADVADEAPAAFRYRELILAYWESEIIGYFFVENVKKTGESRYTVNAVDAIGVMASTPYAGQYIGADTDVQTAAADLTGAAFDTSVEQYHIESIRGIISATNKRDALLNFGAGSSLWCAARRSRSAFSNVWYFTPPVTFGDVLATLDPTAGTTVDLTADEIYDGVEFSERVAVDSLEVVSHSFTVSQYGQIQIGNTRYNDTTTVNNFGVRPVVPPFPNVKRIANALTLITGKKDPIHTATSDVELIGTTAAEYLRLGKQIALTAANRFADLGDKIRATVEGVTYTAVAERIAYRAGSSVMAVTFSGPVIKEEEVT